MNGEYVKSILTVLKAIPNKIEEWKEIPGDINHVAMNLELIVPPMARDAVTAIEYLKVENEKLRERLKTDILDYIRKNNYLNLQIEILSKEKKALELELEKFKRFEKIT